MRDANRPLGDVHGVDCKAVCFLKASAPVSRRRALAASVGLSALFLFVYAGCMWITTQRRDVGVFFFSWERAIPFVPFMSVPFLSIDVFFVLAPFLLREEGDLSMFVRRAATAILIAGLIFLLW